LWVSADQPTFIPELQGWQISGFTSAATHTWTIDNLPLSVSQTSGSESYTYDADGERVKVVRGSVTTVYLARLWEEVTDESARPSYL
jgi:YD repeat-containing protein